jgi:hypothetical protein
MTLLLTDTVHGKGFVQRRGNDHSFDQTKCQLDSLVGRQFKCNSGQFG